MACDFILTTELTETTERFSLRLEFLRGARKLLCDRKLPLGRSCLVPTIPPNTGWEAYATKFGASRGVDLATTRTQDAGRRLMTVAIVRG